MNFWQGLGIFVVGCFVGVFGMFIILALCSAAGDADRLIEKQILERYEQEKNQDSRLRIED
jgi:hypothetical protein